MGPLGNNHSDQISPYLPDFESDDESPPILVSAKEDYEKNDPHPIMMAESIKKIEPEKEEDPLELGLPPTVLQEGDDTDLPDDALPLYETEETPRETGVRMRKIKLL